MEYNLPPEILHIIFLKLSFHDKLSVSYTCKYWDGVLKEFAVWKKEWQRLLEIGRNTFLKDVICEALEEVDLSNIDLKNACCRLSDLLLNNAPDRINMCLLYPSYVEFFKNGVLKTNHESVNIRARSLVTNGPCQGYFIKYKNEDSPDDASYTLFRSPENIISSLDRILTSGKRHVLHFRELIYCYPMAVHTELKKLFIKFFFEKCRIRYIVLVPRVLLLCENFSITDAVVVYSSSRTTEVAVILNGSVVKDRWCEIPVGGWQLAEHLHSAFKWINPASKITAAAFNTRDVKSYCWLNVSLDNARKRKVRNKLVRIKTSGDLQSFALADEQYLAAEMMYVELNLPSVIKGLLDGLSDDEKSNCLNHILLSGGNCQLKYLNIRLKKDLVKLYPEYEHIISVNVYSSGMCSETPLNFYNYNMEKKYQAGKKIGISLEDYIIGDY